MTSSLDPNAATGTPSAVGDAPAPTPASESSPPSLSATPTAAAPAAVPRDAAHWAKRITRLNVSHVPEGAVSVNVDGRRIVSPIQGFGQMWQKIYRVNLDGAGVTPAEVIAAWKANFPSFWPRGNRFYAPLTGIVPGEIALLDSTMPGRISLSTGVMVLYADDESFTLMTPEGHVFAGWVTFSAYVEDGQTIAQAEVLMRANDPLFELGLLLGGHRQEDRLWQRTLIALAAHFGLRRTVETRRVCLDPRRQWDRAANVRYNAFLRSALYRFRVRQLNTARLVRRWRPRRRQDHPDD